MKKNEDTKKQKTEIKNVRYSFSPTEMQDLGKSLACSFGSLRDIEAEFDGIKASYKSKTAEAEARIDRLSTDITNGFVMRDTPCFVVYRPADKEKDFYLTELDASRAIEGAYEVVPVLTEKMTANDFQQEIIQV